MSGPGMAEVACSASTTVTRCMGSGAASVAASTVIPCVVASFPTAHSDTPASPSSAVVPPSTNVNAILAYANRNTSTMMAAFVTILLEGLFVYAYGGTLGPHTVSPVLIAWADRVSSGALYGLVNPAASRRYFVDSMWVYRDVPSSPVPSCHRERCDVVERISDPRPQRIHGCVRKRDGCELHVKRVDCDLHATWKQLL